MKPKLWAGMAVFAVCLLVQPAAAGDYEDGFTAARSGDYETAIRLWKPLAEQGVAAAQNYLGVMYDIGDGVPQDYAEAVKWYRKAAEQGNADAQNNLGFEYEWGRGVLLDLLQAHMWFNLAATNGEANVIKYNDRVAKRMTPGQIAEAERMAREWVAAHAKK